MYNLVAEVPHKTPTGYRKSLADIFSTKYIMPGICNVNNFQNVLHNNWWFGSHGTSATPTGTKADAFTKYEKHIKYIFYQSIVLSCTITEHLKSILTIREG